MERRYLFLIIVLLVLISYVNMAEASSIFFEENFNTLDVARWSFNTNTYPEPAISITSGKIHMGQPGTSSLDFPYVNSLVNPFPLTGDFSIIIGFQYTSIAGKGSGLKILDGNNAYLNMGFWSDSSNAIFGTDPHIIEYQITGTSVTQIIDGSVQESFSLASRPTQIWFGHPTVGQLHSSNGPSSFVDSTGVVTRRWWGNGVWTTFDIDFIRVTTTAAPIPGSILLLGSGLPLLVIFRGSKNQKQKNAK